MILIWNFNLHLPKIEPLLGLCYTLQGDRREGCVYWYYIRDYMKLEHPSNMKLAGDTW